MATTSTSTTDPLTIALCRVLNALADAAHEARDRIRADHTYEQCRLLIDAQSWLVRLEDAAKG